MQEDNRILKKILISVLIAIGLLSGAIVRGESTSGDSGRRKTMATEKRGRRRGFRKKMWRAGAPAKDDGNTKGTKPTAPAAGYIFPSPGTSEAT